MLFKFTASQHFDFITQFAEQIGVSVRDNFLEIPKKLGEGFVRKVAFGSDFRLLVHRYTLKEDLVIRRNPAIEQNDLISIFFYNNEQPIELNYNNERPVPFSQKNDSAIQVTTNDLSSTIRFPANSHTQYMVVGITASKLKSLLFIDKPNATISTIAVITGAAGGIGTEITRRFIDEGANVCAVDISNEALDKLSNTLGNPKNLITEMKAFWNWQSFLSY